ncbi:MAG: hypothetical protein KC466_09035, partial [Myxococcales bacterium]|nr:hypothetical protein [Myxococcales bacterium]
SHDGRFVAFDSPSPLVGTSNVSTQIYIRDRVAGETRLASRNVLGERGSGGASGGGETSVAMSADGGWVAFTSTADNLVGGDTNNFADIFVAPNPFTERIPFPNETGF